jgi:hypothetical protein
MTSIDWIKNDLRQNVSTQSQQNQSAELAILKYDIQDSSDTMYQAFLANQRNDTEQTMSHLTIAQGDTASTLHDLLSFHTNSTNQKSVSALLRIFKNNDIDITRLKKAIEENNSAEFTAVEKSFINDNGQVSALMQTL